MTRRTAQDIIQAAFERSVDGGAANPLLGSRLHDFGFRGCTCVEQVRATHQPYGQAWLMQRRRACWAALLICSTLTARTP
jgi:hypothetical protein